MPPAASAEFVAGMPLSVLAALWCALLSAQRARGFVTRAVENPEHVPCFLWTGCSAGGYPLFHIAVSSIRHWHTAEATFYWLGNSRRTACHGCPGRACIVHCGWGSASENSQHERCKHKGVELQCPHTPTCNAECSQACNHVPRCVFLSNS
jgi:hypothetical protein